MFVEYDTPEQAAMAIKSKDGHALDKTHKLRVNRFTDVEKYASASDKYVEPEIDPYIQKVQFTALSRAHIRNIYEVGSGIPRHEINSSLTEIRN